MIDRHAKVNNTQWIIRTPRSVNVYSGQTTVTSPSGRKHHRYSLRWFDTIFTAPCYLAIERWCRRLTSVCLSVR